MGAKTVLISGAGIAGPTLAFWLARQGFAPTLVERSGLVRSSGSPVDVSGEAVEVVEKMGLLGRLRDAATQVAGMSFVDARGRPAGRVDLETLHRASGTRDVEVPRGDLARVLQDAARDSTELLFDDSIERLAQDEGGVDVTFERAPPRRFDLVIGADGLHSRVRRLAFGPESQFVRHAGFYVATLPLQGAAEVGREITMFNAPGRSVTIHPSRERALVAFIFRSPEIAGFDHRNTEQHKAIIARAYADDGWRVPALLEEVHRSGDLYFDSVSRVQVPSWSRGRIALLGDAASCVSLFGNGSSLALCGGLALAQALAAHPSNPQLAFEEYEALHRTRALPSHRNMALASSLLIPATQGGITARNLFVRLWPIAAAASWVGRQFKGRESSVA
jgi:2-polyprenyl-6-methoxyphenol hydroxylase-like FAD-dependent oxidoreductase